MKNLAAPVRLGILALIGLLSFPGLSLGEMSIKEEAALFSLADLGQVDMSPKTVKVEIFLHPAGEIQPFQRMFPWVWDRVQQFYARMGVNLVHLPGLAKPGPLAPGERLRLEVLPQKEWLAKSCQAFEVPPPFRLSFMAVCRGKYAFAHLPQSMIHFSFKSFQEGVVEAQAGGEKHNPRWLAHVITHELGHLVGLFHAHEFVNGPYGEFLADGKTPNVMSHYLTYTGDLGFVDIQKRLVHSFLGKGKVYRQYKFVDFDPLRYLELLKRHNGYQEPPRPKARERDWRERLD